VIKNFTFHSQRRNTRRLVTIVLVPCCSSIYDKPVNATVREYVCETVSWTLIVIDVAATRYAGGVVPERRQGVARVVLRRACVSTSFRAASSRMSAGQFV